MFNYMARPEARGFVHKRIIGGIGGLLTGGPLGGIAGFFGGGGGVGSGVVQGQGAVPGQFSSLTDIRNVGGVISHGESRCDPPFVVDPATGRCTLETPGVRGALQRFLPGGRTGFEHGTSGQGMMRPAEVCVPTQVCPTFPDGKKGILWMNAMTGEVVCLPRGCSGKGFGLVRKNRPRRKPYISAAKISQLKSMATTKKKAKEFARLTGQACVTRGR